MSKRKQVIVKAIDRISELPVNDGTIKVRAPVNDGTIVWIKLYRCERKLHEQSER